MKNNFLKILIFISLIIFIFLCIVFAFFYNKTNQNNQKAKLGMETWQTEADQRDNITSLNNSLEQVSGENALLYTHFAKSSDIVPFLDTLEQFGAPTGASVAIVSVETGTNNSQLVVDLKVTGTFEQVYKVLTLLENSPYEISFNSMDLHKLSDPNVKGSEWEANFEIQLLSFIP